LIAQTGIARRTNGTSQGSRTAALLALDGRGADYLWDEACRLHTRCTADFLTTAAALACEDTDQGFVLRYVVGANRPQCGQAPGFVMPGDVYAGPPANISRPRPGRDAYVHAEQTILSWVSEPGTHRTLVGIASSREVCNGCNESLYQQADIVSPVSGTDYSTDSGYQVVCDANGARQAPTRTPR
jgi:hypothetical protein